MFKGLCIIESVIYFYILLLFYFKLVKSRQLTYMIENLAKNSTDEAMAAK